MEFKKFKSDYIKNVNISRYLIKWDKYPSKEQKILQDFLYPYWKNKVILAEFFIPGSKFRIDLMNVSNRLVIEYSPDSTHFEFNKFFHGSRVSGYLKRLKTDTDKIEWCIENNFKVIELSKEDLDYLSYNYFVKKFGVNL